MDALLLVPPLIAAGGGLFVVMALDERRPRGMEPVRLRFGSDLTSDAVLALLAGVAGLPQRTEIVFDVLADAHGIKHVLNVDREVLESLRGLLRGVIPSARLDAATSAEDLDWQMGARLSWSSRHLLLRTDQVEHSSAALLGTLSALGSNERVMLRFVVRPARRIALSKNSDQRRSALPFLPDPSPTAEQIAMLRKKYAGPLLEARLVLAVASRRPSQLLSQVASVIRARQGALSHLRVRPVRGRRLERLLASSHPWRGHRMAPAELAGLLGWPIAAPSIPA
jgi:hypothetical protein